jgi:hypothetical protein
MIKDFLPIITVPNDTNESDISIITKDGETITASSAMKKYPELKELMNRKIKLMADSSIATMDAPQIIITSYLNNNVASISFYCSIDNYGRETSASLIFAEGQKEELKLLISKSNLPLSLQKIAKDLQVLIEKFNFIEHIYQDDNSSTLKKKNLFITVFVILLLAAGISYLKRSKAINETKTNITN